MSTRLFDTECNTPVIRRQGTNTRLCGVANMEQWSSSDTSLQISRQWGLLGTYMVWGWGTSLDIKGQAILSSPVQDYIRWTEKLFTPDGKEWKPLNERILSSRGMLDLKKNWDGDGARTIDISTWEKAIGLLLIGARACCRKFGRMISVPNINPVPDGSIDLHWLEVKYEMLINIPVDDHEDPGYYGDDYKKNSIEGNIRNNDIESVFKWMCDTESYGH